MAGLGRRTFAAGEVLTASNVMGYLQDQAVMNFAGTASRGSAIASPSEGMVSYLADTNLIEVYNGSAWKQISATTGNILQVVSTVYNTTQGTSSNSFVTSNLSTTITPKSSSSKILIVCTSNFQGTGAGQRTSATIFRGGMGGTNLGEATYGFSTGYQANGETVFPMAITYLDSPATTSATTYTLAYKTTNFSYIHASGTFSSLVLIEVSA